MKLSSIRYERPDFNLWFDCHNSLVIPYHNLTDELLSPVETVSAMIDFNTHQVIADQVRIQIGQKSTSSIMRSDV